MFPGFMEHNIRPAFLRQVQIHAVGGKVGEAGQGVEALCVLGGVVCPLWEEGAAPAEGVEWVAVEVAVWGEASAADDGGGV